MLKNKYFVYSILLLLIIISFVLSILNYVKSCQNEIIVADTQKLFNGFRMTQDTKKTGDVILKKMKFSLDSLYSELKNSKTNEAKSEIIKNIEVGRSNFDNFNANYSAQETAKIMERLNSYIIISARTTRQQCLLPLWV